MSIYKTKTAQAVSLGHPDRLVDYISESIFDNVNSENSVHCSYFDTVISYNQIMVFGGNGSNKAVNINKVVRRALKEVGYTIPGLLIKSDIISVIDSVERFKCNYIRIGGFIEGQTKSYAYACNDTPNYTSLEYYISQIISDSISAIKNHERLELYPYNTVTTEVEYNEQDEAVRIESIVVEFHTSYLPQEILEMFFEELGELVINDLEKHSQFSYLFDDKTSISFYPFAYKQIMTDTAVSGKSLIENSYNGLGSKSYAGKQMLSANRISLLCARYIAKNIVAAKFADRTSVDVTIHPNQTTFMLNVDTHNSNKTKFTDIELSKKIMNMFDFSLDKISNQFHLSGSNKKEVIRTGIIGGETEFHYWEKLDLVDKLKTLTKD